MLRIVHIYVHGQQQKNSPEEELLEESTKNLKILQSTGYIKHGLIFGLLWEIPERKIPFIHTALLLEKYTRFHAETQCRTGHLFQSTRSLVLFSVNLKQEGKW